MEKISIWHRLMQKKDSDFVIVGIILAIVAVILNAFIWHNNFKIVFALIDSVCIGLFIVAIKLFFEHPEFFIGGKSLKYPFTWLCILGIVLINFTVIIVATNVTRISWAGLTSLIVWLLLVGYIDISRTDGGAEFWITIGTVVYAGVYLISYTLTAVLL